MAGIRLEGTVFDHPKILKLSGLMKADPMLTVSRMCALWCWALDAGREDGRIDDLPEGRTAVIMRCKTPSKTLLRFLKDAKLVDPNGCIHNWRKRTGRYFEEKRRGELRREAGYWRERKKGGEMGGTAGATEVPPIHSTPILSKVGEEGGSGGDEGGGMSLWEMFEVAKGRGSKGQFAREVEACDAAGKSREEIGAFIVAHPGLDAFDIGRGLIARVGGNGKKPHGPAPTMSPSGFGICPKCNLSNYSPGYCLRCDPAKAPAPSPQPEGK